MAERILEKTEVTVAGLVDKIANRELLLPKMQRRYVWRSTRVRDLLDHLHPAIQAVESLCGHRRVMLQPAF